MDNQIINIGDKVTITIRKSKYCNCSFGTNKNESEIRQITITIKDKQDIESLEYFKQSSTLISIIKHDKTESGDHHQ